MTLWLLGGANMYIGCFLVNELDLCHLYCQLQDRFKMPSYVARIYLILLGERIV